MYAPCKFLVGSISSLLVPFVYRKPVLSPAVALHTLHIMKLFVRDNYIESSTDGMGVKKRGSFGSFMVVALDIGLRTLSGWQQNH